jgi:hypothetical protein
MWIAVDLSAGKQALSQPVRWMVAGAGAGADADTDADLL